LAILPNSGGEVKKNLIWLAAIFGLMYILPVSHPVFQKSLMHAVWLLHDYATKHVLLCLVPAFFIAGAIAVFLKSDAILKYLGPAAKKYIAYPLASVSGGILAVCSCTILPLFAGIWKRGAGIGPAISFLYAGPAINIAAIFLTGTVLGWELSIVRLITSVVLALVMGTIMGLIFDRKTDTAGPLAMANDESTGLSRWETALLFILWLAILITGGLKIAALLKTILIAVYIIGITYITFGRMQKDKRNQWGEEVGSFTLKIMPLLFAGVFIAGFLTKALPESLVHQLLGGNGLGANFVASVFGALMYFATLTEVPIIQAFMELGMGKGPALTLFLAGYSLSLPNMIVLFRLMGAKKALTYFAMVIVFSALSGFAYGNLM
jgi:hypothetical protein